MPAPIPSAQYTELPEENIASPHVRNHQPAPAIEKSCLQDQTLQKKERGRQNQSHWVQSPSVPASRFGRQPCISIDAFRVVPPGRIWKMKEIGLKSADVAVDLQRFMNEVALPASTFPII